MTRWIGWLDECAFLWARSPNEACTSYTTQHMCVDNVDDQGQHESTGHMCRCGKHFDAPRRPRTRKQRRAARDAKFPHDTPEAFQS